MLHDAAIALVNEKSHVRGLAKKLGANSMAVSRALKKLADNNVLDFENIGKNKVYSIKKTEEARNFIIIAEMLRLNSIIQKHPQLRMIADEIQKNKEIKLAILFGSYAKETYKEKSDIDIFIETKKRKIKDKIALLDSSLSIKIGDFNTADPLIREIMKNHIIIKGVEIYYEKTGLFN